VDLWNEVTVERADKFEIIAEGEGADDMPLDDSNYLCVGVMEAFKVANKPLPTLRYKVVNNIPYARGLGSSSAAIVAGIIAGLVLAGHRLPYVSLPCCYCTAVANFVELIVGLRSFFFPCGSSPAAGARSRSYKLLRVLR
jgi:shikimate kinase